MDRYTNINEIVDTIFQSVYKVLALQKTSIL